MKRITPILWASCFFFAAACDDGPPISGADDSSTAELDSSTDPLDLDHSVEPGDTGSDEVGQQSGMLSDEILTPSGRLRGVGDRGVNVFRGIPYARPPTGSRRWRPPEAHAGWEETRDATQFGPVCPQIESWGLAPPDCTQCEIPICEAWCQSEDCLYLNVWTPAEHVDDALPVMLWIHGGSFVYGSGSYVDASALARRGDVVVVAINYRLGPLGAFSLDALGAERGDCEHCGPANFGLLDQIQALRWVNDNIASFGGDPENLTIFGESAGGFSVCNLLSSPLAAGLFQQAIVQSAYCVSFIRPMHDTGLGCPALNTIEEEGLWNVVSMDCLGKHLSDALDCGEAEDPLTCLREAGAWEVLNALPQSKGFEPGFSWAPFLDGGSLPLAPAEAIRMGDFSRVPLMAGATSDESSVFFWPTGPDVATRDGFELFLSWWEDCADELGEIYSTASDSEVGAAYLRLLSDLHFSCPLRLNLGHVSAHGTAVFLYELDYLTEYGESSGLGAFHSSEIPFVFQDFPTPQRTPSACEQQDGGWHCCDAFGHCFGPRDLDFSNLIVDLWTSFATSGVPTAANVPVWPDYQESTDLIMRLNLAPVPEEHPRSAACEVWEGVWSDLYGGSAFCDDSN